MRPCLELAQTFHLILLVKTRYIQNELKGGVVTWLFMAKLHEREYEHREVRQSEQLQ